MEVLVRGAVRGDLDQIAQIEAACFPVAQAATREALQSRLNAYPDHFLVAEHQGTAIGFINGAVVNEETLRDEMYTDVFCHTEQGAYQTVFGLDVLPEYRKQGIAHRLMEEFVAQAKVQGRKGVILTCKNALVTFYKKMGYRHLGVSASVHGGVQWNDMLLPLHKTGE